LLTHSHSLGNIKEELLAELSHIPLAIFGVTAGWARWLELRLTGSPRRVSAWICVPGILAAVRRDNRLLGIRNIGGGEGDDRIDARTG
jgi:hypothetical protein